MILRSLLYIISAILFLGWLVGFFIYKGGPLIHMMLALSVVSLVIALFRKEGLE